MGINSKGQITFAYGHSFLTVDEIENDQEMTQAISARPVEFTPSVNETEMERFLANLWTPSLMA